MAIGALVLSFGAKAAWVGVAVWVALVLSIFQIVLALWSVVAQWTENLAEYLEAKKENYYLSDRYTELGNNTTYTDAEWRTEFAVLETRGLYRLRGDLSHDITDEEKRMGMRISLRQFRRKCSSCGEIPQSVDASACPVCGNYKKRKWRWLI